MGQVNAKDFYLFICLFLGVGRGEGGEGSRWWLVESVRILFKTSWEGLQKVLPIVVAAESRMLFCVLSLPQWHWYCNFELLVSHTNVNEIMASFSGAVLMEMILPNAHPEVYWHTEVYWHHASSTVYWSIQYTFPIFHTFDRDCESTQVANSTKIYGKTKWVELRFV